MWMVFGGLVGPHAGAGWFRCLSKAPLGCGAEFRPLVAERGPVPRSLRAELGGGLSCTDPALAWRAVVAGCL